MSVSGVLRCKVDESGGMAHLYEAEALLTDAYGPGAWVTDESTHSSVLDPREEPRD